MLVHSLYNSLIVAVVTTVLSVALGTGGAWLLYRYRFPAVRLVQTLVFIPMIIPEVIMGVSLLILFVVIHLELGFTTIIISHITFCFPFVMVAVQARLSGLDPALEEAAMDLGAPPRSAFRKVLVPYLMPAIVSGALMSFTLSLDELIVTYFTASAGTRTLPLEIFGRVKKGLDPTLNAISTVFILSTVVLVDRHRAAETARPLTRDLNHKEGMKRHRDPCRLARLCAARAGGVLPLVEEPPKELNLFAWSEYVPQAVIDGFTKETGIKVNYETYASNEEMLAKLVSGAQQYDLIQPSEYTVEALVKEKQLLPIDWSKVPNVKNIAPRYHEHAARPAAEVHRAVDGRHGRHRRQHRQGQRRRSRATRTSSRRSTRAASSCSTIRARSSAGRWRPRQGHQRRHAGDLAAVKPILEQWLPLIKVYDSDSPKTALLNGDVDLGVVWSRRGGAALQRGSRSSSTSCRPRARTCSSTASPSRPMRRIRRRRWRS